MPLRWLCPSGMILCLGALLATSAPIAAPVTKAPELQELMIQARRQNRVPVIVTLAMDDAKTADPAAIRAVQQQLLTELAYFHMEILKLIAICPC